MATDRPLWLEDAAEWLSGWWPALALVAVGLTIWMGFHFPGFGIWEARAIICGLPLLILGAALLSVREEARVIAWVAVAVVAVGVLAAELRGVWALDPATPFAREHLSAVGAQVQVEPPADTHEVDVRVHADLTAKGADSQVDYRLALDRGGDPTWADGKLERRSARRRRFRGSPGGHSTTLYETREHDVAVAGDAPLTLRLDRLSGKLPGGLDVALARPRPLRHTLDLALLVALGLAVVLQPFAQRKPNQLPLAALAAMVTVFGWAVGHWYNPDETFTFTLGATIAAVAGGGIAGWLLGGVAKRILGPRPA